MVHSKVSPSKAHIWTHCTCFENLPSTTAGNQGTEYHAYAEDALKNGVIAPYPVQQYVDYVKSLDGELHIEEAIKLDPLMPGYDLGYGYCDSYVINAERASLEVIDLKTGRVLVSPVENLQLAIYAYCIIKNSNIPIGQIKLTIHQGGDLGWSITYDELEKLIEERVKPGVHRVLGNAQVRERGSYCQWCANQDTCKAYLDWLDAPTMDPVEIVEKAKYWNDLADNVKRKVKEGAISDERFIITDRQSLSWKENIEVPEDLYAPIKPTAALLKKRPELIELVDSNISQMVSVK